MITQDNRPIAFFSRKLFENATEIQCHGKGAPGPSRNTKGFQRDAVGARHQSVH
jgi:hypothetical protein